MRCEAGISIQEKSAIQRNLEYFLWRHDEISNIYIQLFDSSPVTIDRSVIQEDQTNGQVIRAYTVDVQIVNTTDTNQWFTVAQGTSIGNKKIDVWQGGLQLINAVRLTITKSVDRPVIKSFTVHLCS
ncbi:unnamed protein product [Rotaria socialis]|uniref:F5/8 type C domain-containing protein n=1 Tax=Rotaria socialis TaxID=392032 RepID=A0A818DMC5_9BILA|nr:unnamed protein product [Rotaria socialis]